MVSCELDQYLSNSLRLRQYDAEPASWYMQLGLLGTLATIILRIKVTISDVERVNKVYAYTQTPERNGLLLGRVNILVKGRLAIKAKQRDPIQVNKGVFCFIDDAEKLAVDSAGWLKGLQKCEKALKIMEVAEDDVGKSNLDAQQQDASVGSVLFDLTGDEGEESNSESEPPEDFVPEVISEEVPVRRSSRRVRVPENFKQARALLGLRDYEAAAGSDSDDEDSV